VFIAAVLIVACLAYVQFWWMLVQGELPQVSSWIAQVSGTTDVDVHVQASASMLVERMGLPVYASGFPYLWPTHVMFFTVVWVGFLMVAFVDLTRRIRL
jgi:hypothetical protein